MLSCSFVLGILVLLVDLAIKAEKVVLMTYGGIPRAKKPCLVMTLQFSFSG